MYNEGHFHREERTILRTKSEKLGQDSVKKWEVQNELEQNLSREVTV